MNHAATPSGTSALSGLVTGERRPSVVLSYGLGLDSTVVLLRWLAEPACRDFDLADLVVVTAMTGHESAETIAAVTTLVLPRLRDRGIRLIQAARSQRRTTRAGSGVVVLDDSREPQRLYAAGSYTLGDEMLSAATLPQLGGSRLCSVHAKGDILDPVIARITEGHPFRHVIGFEANEIGRAAKDQQHNTAVRCGWYPLIEWGWTRADCRRWMAETVRAAVPKSCCSFCPFAMSSAGGRAQVIERYRREPQLGADAMFLEHVARSINPAQTLITGSSVADLVIGANVPEVLELFEAKLAGGDWSLYEVRRVARPGKDGRRGIVARSVKIIATGSREAMAEQLGLQSGRPVLGRDGIMRHVVRDRADGRTDHLFVAAPAGAHAKQRTGFEQWWNEATGEALF